MLLNRFRMMNYAALVLIFGSLLSPASAQTVCNSFLCEHEWLFWLIVVLLYLTSMLIIIMAILFCCRRNKKKPKPLPLKPDLPTSSLGTLTPEHTQPNITIVMPDDHRKEENYNNNRQPSIFFVDGGGKLREDNGTRSAEPIFYRRGGDSDSDRSASSGLRRVVETIVRKQKRRPSQQLADAVRALQRKRQSMTIAEI